MNVAALQSRWKQARRFVASANAMRDVPAAFLLGVARGSPFNSSNWMTSLGFRWFHEISVRPRRLGGERVIVNTSDLGQLISYEEIMVEGSYDMDLVPFVPELIVDCGAHSGLFTRLASLRFRDSKIIAFEPNPTNTEIFRKQITHQCNQIQLVEAAVAADSGDAWFTTEFSNTGRLRSPKEDKDGWKVKVISLPKFLADKDAATLLLKLDIEGEERRLISKLTPALPFVCAIFFETHDGDRGWNDVTSELIEAGFDVRKLRCRGRFVDGFALRTLP